MKYKVVLFLLVLLFSCKGIDSYVTKTINPEAAAGVISLFVLQKIFEDDVFIVQDSSLSANVSTIKLLNISISYSKNGYTLNQKIDSVIATPDGVDAATLRMINSDWPDYLSFDSSQIKVKFRSSLLDSMNTLITDTCIESSLIFINSDSIQVQKREIK